MKVGSMLLLLLGALPVVQGAATEANPLGKVLQLMDELLAKIVKDGETAEKAYHEYVEWCDDTAKNTAFAIKTGTDQVGKLQALITEKTSDIEVAETEIAKLAAAISESTADLKKATTIREKEAADFSASEKEMMESVDALQRAVKILGEEMDKNPASFAQVDMSSVSSALMGLSTVLDAAAFSVSDRQKLVALAQEHSDSEDEIGAPAPAAYKSHSGGIMDVLEDMKEKAEEELSELRKAEVTSKNNYEMLKQGLEDKIAADTKDMEEEKAEKAAAEEAKATAEGDLEATTAELAQSKKELETAQHTCMTTAADHEASVAAQAEEMKVVKEAKKILEETSSGAVSQSYSLLQLSTSATSKARATGEKVVSMVKKLAQKHHSTALAQLASRMVAELKFGNHEDPFGKIKGLISDMIAKLEKEAEEEATEKAYCDEEMGKTETKKSELEDDTAKMTTKIDQAASKSAELKEQVKELEGELATIAKEQAEMDKIRQEQHEAFSQAKADLELGLGGVRKALKVLRDYYASKDEAASAALLQEDDDAKFGAFMQQPSPPVMHSKSGGAASGIIGILEVCESDFATDLAKEEAEEADSQSEYEKMTQENKVTTASKSKDVKYKTQESKSLDTTIAEVSADLETANTELAAVNEYYAKLKERCIAKPETYEERKKRREAEIAGLKEALSILEDETAFVQKRSRSRRHRRHLRASALEADQ